MYSQTFTIYDHFEGPVNSNPPVRVTVKTPMHNGSVEVWRDQIKIAVFFQADGGHWLVDGESFYDLEWAAQTAYNQARERTWLKEQGR